ncbi:MAG: RHS repeat-associated core domain-containing protein [Acidobacteriota bacterium]
MSKSDRSGRVTTYLHDDLGRLVKTTFPGGASMQSAYDAAGRMISSTDALGHLTTYEYDAAGRRTRVIDALGGQTDFEYDGAGNQVAMTDPNRHTSTSVYDDLGRLVQMIYPDGTRREVEYDALGQRTAETDQAGLTTRFGYDALGRLLTVTDALDQVTRYAYDEQGNRISQTDANGHTTRFEYDEAGRMTRRALPDGLAETFEYDARGNLARRIDFKGAVTTYDYDEAGRLLARSSATGSRASFTYTATGRRETATDARGTTRYSYDSRGRLTALVYPDGQRLGYAYDAQGNRTGLTAQVGAASLSASYTYDALYRLTGEAVAVSNATVYQKSFEYDPVGNRLKQVHTGGAAGGGFITSYEYDARDRLTREGAKEWTWDANGNLAGKEGQSSYGWDSEDRLQFVTLADGTVVTNTYDADGVRTRTETRKPDGTTAVVDYLVDTSGPLSRVIAESAGGALTAYYLQGEDLLAVLRPEAQGWTSRFYHADGLGSIRALTDETGLVTDRYSFTAFGELTLHTGEDESAYLFGGEELDPSSGFYYLRARWMDPGAGRFASADPFGGFDYDPASLHKYLYANLDPVRNTDPSGLFTIVDVLGSMLQTTLAYGQRAIRAYWTFEKANSFINALLVAYAVFAITRAFLEPQKASHWGPNAGWTIDVRINSLTRGRWPDIGYERRICGDARRCPSDILRLSWKSNKVRVSMTPEGLRFGGGKNITLYEKKFALVALKLDLAIRGGWQVTSNLGRAGHKNLTFGLEFKVEAPGKFLASSLTARTPFFNTDDF